MTNNIFEYIKHPDDDFNYIKRSDFENLLMTNTFQVGGYDDGGIFIFSRHKGGSIEIADIDQLKELTRLISIYLENK